MIEQLVLEIRQDPAYRVDFDGLVLERMNQSLGRRGPQADPGPGRLERLVQSAGILGLSTDAMARREAFTIASSAYELYGEALGGLHDVLALVMSRLGNFPAIDFRTGLSCPLLSGPSTMTVWIKEGTTNAFEEAQARRDHRQAA